ncbi:MAG: peroxiredoxin [Chloroflexi bacterium]|nr:peroxiredoxin [Chloroflexota bacterium]
MASSRLKVGDTAPDFSLLAHSGEQVRLAQFRGKNWVVLYFYPKDETLGCTAEACAFRDNYSAFQQAGAEVIGISGDSITSHRHFSYRNRLPFPLLSDEENAVRKLYGVQPTYGLIPGRVTFIIDPQGKIRHIFDSQFNPEAHIQEALQFIHSQTPARELAKTPQDMA